MGVRGTRAFPPEAFQRNWKGTSKVGHVRRGVRKLGAGKEEEMQG
jgi:hypothetical protein